MSSAEQQAAQTAALERLASLVVGAQFQQQVPSPMHSAPSIPFPKPINIKDGDIVENFKFFQLQWNNYLIASGTSNQTEEIKKSTLLAAIGDDCLKLYTSFVLSDTDKESEQSLLNAIGRNLTPVVNKRYERAVFNLATQKSKETYVAYCGRLKGLIKNCQYGDLEDDLLLDKLICSINDVVLREQLWLDKDITLEQAMEKCKIKELTQKQLKTIKATENSAKGGDSNKKVAEPSQKGDDNNKQQSKKPIHVHQHKNVTIIQNTQGPKPSPPQQPPQNQKQPQQNKPKLPNAPNQNKQCQACGNKSKGVEHAINRNECPANGVTCNMCGNQNHLTRMCRLKTQPPPKKID